MSTKPLVSAVVTTYDRSHLVQRAIKSVLAQTYDPLEILVVEDGSNSGVETWLKDEGLNRVRYARHRENKGLAAARNTGLYLSRGKYIAFLDDDDSWLCEKIALQVEVLEAHTDKKCLVYCGGCTMYNDEIVREWIPTARGVMSDSIYKGYTLDPSSMLVARDALLSIGGHSEELTSCIDHDIWMKMAHAGFEMDFVPQALMIHGDHSLSQMTMRLAERLEGIEQFFSKWKPVVVAECGIDCWQAIEEVYHLQTIKTIKRKHANGSITRQTALGYLSKLFALQSQPFLWLDYIAYRAGRLSYTPVANHTSKIVKGSVTFPYRKLRKWIGKRALPKPG
jgi:glycosyltransferase involved in cell wall biosynthesis